MKETEKGYLANNSESSLERKYVTIVDAAEILDISETRARKWCGSGGYRLATPTEMHGRKYLTPENIRRLWVAKKIQEENNPHSLQELGRYLRRDQLGTQYLRGDEWESLVTRAEKFGVDMSIYTFKSDDNSIS